MEININTFEDFIKHIKQEVGDTDELVVDAISFITGEYFYPDTEDIPLEQYDKLKFLREYIKLENVDYEEDAFFKYYSFTHECGLKFYFCISGTGVSTIYYGGASVTQVWPAKTVITQYLTTPPPTSESNYILSNLRLLGMESNDGKTIQASHNGITFDLVKVIEMLGMIPDPGFPSLNDAQISLLMGS